MRKEEGGKGGREGGGERERKKLRESSSKNFETLNNMPSEQSDKITWKKDRNRE